MFATKLKKLFVSSALVGIALTASSLALAQTNTVANFPNKPIKLLVGFAPGGGTDAAARTIAIKLSEILGQTVVVDNKPGAGGNIAADLVAKAPGDGYTIGLANIGSLAVNPHMPNGTPYNTLKDFAMLGNGVSFGKIKKRGHHQKNRPHPSARAVEHQECRNQHPKKLREPLVSFLPLRLAGRRKGKEGYPAQNRYFIKGKRIAISHERRQGIMNSQKGMCQNFKVLQHNNAKTCQFKKQ
jgi:hypothetical protein